MKRSVGMVILLLVVATSAQAGAIDIGQAFSTVLQPYIDAAIQAGIVALVGWVLFVIKKKFNIEIDAKYREMLTAFLQRQAASLVADGAVKLQGVKIEVKNEALATAANTAVVAIPSALDHFGLTPAKLQEMIIDHVPKEPAVAAAQAIALDAHNPETVSKPAASTGL